MGKMMSALGGRLVAFRAGLAQPEALDEAIMRNIYRGDIADPTGLAHVRKGLLDLGQSLAAQLPEQIVEGNATW
jgi:cytochrome b pre-mRNA-processing protein 3